MVGRRPFRPAGSPVVERECVPRHPCRARGLRVRPFRRRPRACASAGGQRPPVPDRTGDRWWRGRRLVCAADRRRAPRCRPARDRRLAGLRPDVRRDRRATGTCSRCSPGPRRSTRPSWALAIPAPTPHRAARRAGHAEPVDGRGWRAGYWPSCSAHPRRTIVASAVPRAVRPARVAGPAARSAMGRRGSSTRRPPRNFPGDPGAGGAFDIRPATADDATPIADVWLASWRATFDFGPAHPDEDVRRWVREELLLEAETGSRSTRRTVTASSPCWGCPTRWSNSSMSTPTGSGVGSAASCWSSRRSKDLTDWSCTASRSTPARRFYERNGFVAVAFGDGSGNMERQPDVLYRWHPA